MALRSTSRSFALLAGLWVMGGLFQLPARAGTGPIDRPVSRAVRRAARLDWLSVAHPDGSLPHMVDAQGRTVVLRGVNAVGIEDDYYYAHADGSPTNSVPFWPIDPAAYRGACPVNSHLAGEPPLCEVQSGLPEYGQSSAPGSRNDFAQMRAMGFNVVRLPVSWSQLEPAPGQYSSTYLDRIVQVVGWAEEQGIYVMLDMHQDNYSRFTPSTAAVQLAPALTATGQSPDHADGAPPWAVVTDGAPALAPAGQPPFNAFVEAAFTSFWLNRVPTDAAGHALRQGNSPGPGLQDHYIGAMAALAARFVHDPGIVGYEIMNEPLPGVIAPVVFSAGYLYPFYRRVIDALTGQRDGAACLATARTAPSCGYPDLGIHDRHAFFFEPMVLRDLDDAPDQAPVPFSSYPNLVYAPHTYTHVFTLDQSLGLAPAASPYPLSYDQAFHVAEVEARAFGAALFSGEFGNAPADDATVLVNEMAAQDRAMVGSTLWMWKGDCAAGSSASACADVWGMYAADPAPVPAQNLAPLGRRVAYVSRVWPRATAGTLESFFYDPVTKRFTMTASAAGAVKRGDVGAETVVFIPSTVTSVVAVEGKAALDGVVTEPDGTRLAYAAPTAVGEYRVTVTPTP